MSPAKAPATLLAAGFLASGIMVFSVQDLILKLLSDRYPLHEAMVIRSVAAAPILLILVLRDGGMRTLVTPGWRGMSMRGVLNFLAYTAYYLALAALPIATTVALFFTAPLFIAILAAVFLRERISPTHRIAILGGFVGVLAMTRPGSAVFDWAALLAVASGLFYASGMVMARALGRTDTAAAMSFHSNVAFLTGALLLSAVFGTGSHEAEAHRSLAFLTRGWQTPGTVDLLLMISCGAIAAIALTLLTQAYRIAEANAVAPFEYTAMLWGVVWGWVFWGDWPDAGGWVGIALIIGAGLLVMYGDARAGRKARPA